jgi:bifunctional non-homologous end joining protein LigD
MSKTAEVTRLGGHDVTLTHRDRILFPDDGITKGDILAYYAGIAPYMLPYVREHPLMLQRFPNGIGKPGFIQQEASDYFPEWVERVSVKKEKGRIEHALINNPASLVYLANQGVLTFHMWQSRADKPNFPDRMVFDLDPSGDDFQTACATAKSFRKLLDTIGLPAFVMTTGSRGLHVVVPLDRSEPFESVRDFAREIGGWMAAQLPDHLTVEHRIAKRGDRLFLDPLRNAYAHTAVAPYSVRAKAGAPVATPVTWEELIGCKLGSRHYTIRNVFDRLKKKGDPWKDMARQAVSISKARKQFAALSKPSSSSRKTRGL